MQLAWPQYRITDHLGNSMVFFEDRNDDGLLVTELQTFTPDSLDVKQRLWYYPFGMHMEGIGQTMATPAQAYRYNGKELDEATGLYDYGARYYDPAVARFPSIDRFAEKYAWQSPYVYAGNNPILFIDVNGDSLDVGGNMEASFSDVQNLVPKKFRDRLSLNSETGQVSLITEGLKRDENGALKNGSMAIVLSTTPYPSSQSGSLLTGATSTRAVSTNNASMRVPKEGLTVRWQLIQILVFHQGCQGTHEEELFVMRSEKPIFVRQEICLTLRHMHERGANRLSPRYKRWRNKPLNY